MLELVTLGLMPRQVTPGWMCGLFSGQVATGKMLGLVTLGLMLGQVTPGRMCGLAIPGTISRRTVVYLSDPSITSSVFFRGTLQTNLCLDASCGRTLRTANPYCSHAHHVHTFPSGKCRHTSGVLLSCETYN